jgi:D-3-phosphoglycerate dehydrogenase / 2-oxoglutarate reductase
VRNAVNLPNLDAKTYAVVKPYLELGLRLGRLVGQLAPKRNERLVVTYGGKAAEHPTDPITRSVLKGFLEQAGGKDINQVNVRTMANSLGIAVEEVKNQEVQDFNEWLHVQAFSDGKKISAGGTLIGARNEPRIVRVHSRPVEIVPQGVLFFMTNKDRPGIVGYIGTLMGKYKVNIASMSLSRKEAGGEALTVLNLDAVPPQELLDEVAKDKDISNVKVVTL